MSKRTGIQLCYPFEEKRLDKWRPPYIVQPKLDGDRCRAIFDSDGHVTLLSSEANIIESVPHIVQELENMGFSDVELDGELYIHTATHQAIHGIVSRTVNIHNSFEDMQYHIFDVVSGDTQDKRLMTLYSNVKNTTSVKRVDFKVVSNIAEVIRAMEVYIEDGYEGIVVRDMNAPYVRKRSTQVMKFKPRKSDWYTIVGVEEEISIHGEPKNSLGALWLESEEGARFKVGSGSFLTRDNRRELWERKLEIIGKVAHIKYQHLTERRVPMFPVLIEVIEKLGV
jgi:DNA ligase-1